MCYSLQTQLNTVYDSFKECVNMLLKSANNVSDMMLHH